eukprot:7942481-Ditylum_brightwellii.AAC.1
MSVKLKCPCISSSWFPSVAAIMCAQYCTNASSDRLTASVTRLVIWLPPAFGCRGNVGWYTCCLFVLPCSLEGLSLKNACHPVIFFARALACVIPGHELRHAGVAT